MDTACSVSIAHAEEFEKTAKNMNLSNFPRKNLAISALAALIILVFGVWSAYQRGVFGTPSGQYQAATTPSPSAAGDVDTDGDSLSDWKEALYGSDIKNRDTDGDGTGDGDEIRIDRNPAVPNTAKPGSTPNDYLPKLAPEPPSGTSTSVADVKRAFFEKYLSEEARGIRESTFRDIVNKVDPQKFAPAYDIAELNISSDNSNTSVKTYVNAFGEIINKYLTFRMPESEDTLISLAVSGKADAAEDLKLIAVNYRNFSNDLYKLTVPSSIAKAHLLIVNGYRGMSDGLFALANTAKDPINGTAGYQAHTKYRLDVTSGYAMIVAYVGKNQITFTSTEAGYPFYWNTSGSPTR